MQRYHSIFLISVLLLKSVGTNLNCFLHMILIFLFYQKETLTQVFSCEFCEIFKNTYFVVHLQNPYIINEKQCLTTLLLTTPYMGYPPFLQENLEPTINKGGFTPWQCKYVYTMELLLIFLLLFKKIFLPGWGRGVVPNYFFPFSKFILFLFRN